MGTVHDIFKKSNNPIASLVEQGWVYDLSDSAANTTQISTTTYANTTPMYGVSLAAASGLAAIPLYATLGQTGTVAGGAITVIMEKDNAARLSGGSNMTSMNTLTMASGLPTGASALILPTATNAYGLRMWGITVGQDVSPAEGVSNELVWTPPAGPEYLVTTASVGAYWGINVNAGTTGATLFCTLKVAIFPLTEL